MKKINKNLKTIWNTDPMRLWILLYFPTYLIAFFILEHVASPTRRHILTTPVDRAIPFLPVFVIPYFFWFLFHLIAFILTIQEKDALHYYQMAFAIFSGMTVFIIVSAIFPNHQDLRPLVTRTDPLSIAVRLLYTIDTPNNVMPSIHVYDALILNTAMWRCQRVNTSRYSSFWKSASLMMTILIILATMFLKQHTIWDVLGAFLMYFPMYRYFYCKFKVPEYLKIRSHRKEA